MSVRRPGTGRRVSVGRVRVDAARAIAKLRDYQLPDRTAWVLEGVRAAVASEAVRIDLRGDANDVWLSWEGEPWPADILPRLLDELVSPEPARRGQRLRLLATAINSGLGVEPAYIDVYSIPADGEAVRTRYTPEVLEVPDGDGEPPLLELLDAEPASPPPGAIAPGMMVHLRRRAGLETIGYFMRGEPPEVALALSACGDVPVPMSIEGNEIGRYVSRDLMRVPLGRDLNGFVALVDPRTDRRSVYSPLIDVAERGVIITSFPITLGAREPRSRVPLRVFIDAARMPTNASRSDVQRGAHPIPEALEAAPEALATLCEGLAQRLADPDHEQYEALRAAALALIGASVSGAGWGLRVLDLIEPVRSLARTPLLANAVGQHRPVVEVWDDDCIHTGRRPFDDDLAPWLGQVLWIPSDDAGARFLVGEFRADSTAKKRARMGRRYLKARRRFMRHAERAPRLGRPRRYWIKASTTAPLEGSCAPADGAHDGELCIMRGGRGAEIVLLHRGREIEDVEIGSEICYRAVVDPKNLTPADGYRAVQRDQYYSDAEIQVKRAVVRATEAVALALDGELPPDGFEIGPRRISDDAGARELVRRGIRLATELFLTIDVDSPLSTAPVWELHGGGHASLNELRKQPAIGVASFWGSRAAPRDRPMVLADTANRELLARVLEPATVVVHYDPYRLPDHRDVAGVLARELVSGREIAALAIREDRRRGAIAWGVAESSLRIHHAGTLIAHRPFEPELEPCAISVDSDDAIPVENWASVRDIESFCLVQDFSDWESALARAIARAMLGEQVDDLSYRGSAPPPDWGAGRRLMLALSTTLDPEGLLGPELFERLCNAEIFPVFGAANRSAAQLATDFPDAIQYIEHHPLGARPIAGWHPLIADPAMARGVGSLARSAVTGAAAELERRQKLAARDQNLARFRTQPEAELALPNRGPHVAIEDDGISGLIGPGSRTGLELVVYIEGRIYLRTERPCHLPLVAAVEIDQSLADDQFTSVPTSTLERLDALAVGSVSGLLASIIDADAAAMTRIAPVRQLWLAYVQSQLAEAEFTAMRQRFNSIDAFHSVQGQWVSIDAAGTGGTLRIASWIGDWLPGDEGDTSWLDEPIVRLADGATGAEIRQLLSCLSPRPLTDVTEPLRRLQTARRMSRGLLPVPTITGAMPEYKAPLRELDAEMPPGEIALTAESLRDTASAMHVFRDGIEVGELPVHSALPLIVAIEATELGVELSNSGAVSAGTLEPVRDVVTRATWLLVERVVDRDGADSLPEWLRAALVRALLGGVVPQEQIDDSLGEIELFVTTAGERVNWRRLLDQAERFGDVWVTTADSTDRPLDDDRIAIRVGLQESPTSYDGVVPFKFAAEELALDQTARRNRDRSPATSLALGPGELGSAIVQLELRGDGETSARGLVAPLRPGAGSLRGVHLYRAMKPLGYMPDPCAWPTVAVIDDTRLTPNRTWSAPAEDEIYEELCRELRNASEVALARELTAPKEALTSHSVGRTVEIMDPALAEDDIVIRGRVWLIGEPAATGVHVQLGHHDTTLSPMKKLGLRSVPLPVGGMLMIHPPRMTLPSVPLIRSIELLYPKLLSQVVRRKGIDADRVAAHVAYGLALRVIEPADAGDIEFSGFSEDTLNAVQLAELLSSDAPIVEGSITDDGSAVARTVIDLVGARMRGANVEHIAKRTVDTDAPVDIGLALDDEIEAGVADLKQRPPHALDQLAAAVHARLLAVGATGAQASAVDIDDDRSQPIAEFRDGVVYLAGDNDRLRHIQAVLDDSSEAVDLLVAHVLSVMNHTDSFYTDASEYHGLFKLLESVPQ